MRLKNVTTMVFTLGVLLSMGEFGCSKGDKGAQAQNALLKAMLDAKQRELECKMKVMAKVCPVGDGACEKEKENALIECSKITACNERDAGGSGTNTSTWTSVCVPVETVTATDTNTNSNTNTSTQ